VESTFFSPGNGASFLPTGFARASAQQLRQLGDIRRNPSRLILAEQLGGESPTRLILETDDF